MTTPITPIVPLCWQTSRQLNCQEMGRFKAVVEAPRTPGLDYTVSISDEARRRLAAEQGTHS